MSVHRFKGWDNVCLGVIKSCLQLLYDIIGRGLLGSCLGCHLLDLFLFLGQLRLQCA